MPLFLDEADVMKAVDAVFALASTLNDGNGNYVNVALDRTEISAALVRLTNNVFEPYAAGKGQKIPYVRPLPQAGNWSCGTIRYRLAVHDHDPVTDDCRRCGATRNEIDDNLVRVCDPLAVEGLRKAQANTPLGIVNAALDRLGADAPLPYREPSPVLKSMLVVPPITAEEMVLGQAWRKVFSDGRVEAVSHEQVVIERRLHEADEPGAVMDDTLDALTYSMLTAAAQRPLRLISRPAASPGGDGVALQSMAHPPGRWAEIDKIFGGTPPSTIAPAAPAAAAPPADAGVPPIEPHERPMSKSHHR